MVRCKKMEENMKRPNIFFILGCLFFLFIVACDKISAPGPKDILNKYLNASLKGRYEEAYNHISSADKSIKTLDEYLRENDKKDIPFAKALISSVSYKILKVTEDGERASADVEITLPDMEVIFRDIMGAAFASAFGNKKEKEIEQALAKKYENANIPTTTQKQTFQLVKEQDGWKVFLDWKAEKIKKEKQARIQKLLDEAKQLKKEKKLNGALDKYQQVLKLDSEMVEAQKEIEETKKEIESFKEKQYYIKNVILYGLKAKYYTTIFDERVPGVEFKIKNKGNRTLKEVEVTVYFKDVKGNIIAEETYHPVLVSKYSFGRDNKPLRPNYIWQMERGKFYKADSVPDEWKEGAVSAKITNIEFME